ncbi:MAG: class I tRNA ligase family protein, partial [Candidatus Paceibacteria bacterium]
MKTLPKTYDPAKYEKKIYSLWERGKFFTPKINLKKKPFTIIMPPPNANGDLHIGHALFVSLEDIMIRYQRLRGKPALWLPGADHAGFETQVVFEKLLEKEGKSRFNMEREEFYQAVWDFTQKNKKNMEKQLRSLGASCDWTRNKFTLDKGIVKIVYQTFKRLYDDGLIYRGERLVNYCTHHQTSFSDLEVRYVERKDPLYYIKYGPFTLATVRPETKFGDTAVAVNPKDPRYKHYIGKEIEIQDVLGPAKLKVIADAAVDPDFGTGVVKITPAHDMTDWEIGKRHNLEVRPVIDRNGRMNEKAGPYAGLTVDEARKKVVEDLKKKGLIEKIDENYTHKVGVCYKCGTVIEPVILPQWFIKTKPLAESAISAVKQGKIKIIPKYFEKT